MIRALNARLAAEALIRVDSLQAPGWRSVLLSLVDDPAKTLGFKMWLTLVRLWLAEALYQAAVRIQPGDDE